MKEYIKKFKENTPGYGITYIPWIATVESTKQNLSTNRNHCMTIENNDRLKVVRKTVVKTLKDVIDILDIRGILTRDSILNMSDVIEIEIGDVVTNIEGNIFQDCAGLAFIDIPNSVASIGNDAFYKCGSLTSISYTGTISQWNAITKGSNWKNGVPETVKAHCTDGDVNI